MFLLHGNLKISELLRACLVCVKVVFFFYFYFLYSFSILKSYPHFLFPSIFLFGIIFYFVFPFIFYDNHQQIYIYIYREREREREVRDSGTHKFDFFNENAIVFIFKKMKTQKSCIYFLYSNPIFFFNTKNEN